MQIVIAEGGMLLYTGQDKKLTIHLKEKNGSYKGKPQEVDVPNEFILSTRFGHEIDEFIDCILENKQTDRDFVRGLYIQRIIEALNQSAIEGRKITL